MTTLRTGFTTGTYAAATAAAAVKFAVDREVPAAMDVWFPDGQYRPVNIDGCKHLETGVEAWSIKDAGDDVDVTHNAVVRSRVFAADEAEIDDRDHTKSLGQSRVVIRGGDGVGEVTRRGLEVAVGKWAITPAPLDMITENLRQIEDLLPQGNVVIRISIDNGEALAKKTLNPTLGVMGGLSILGSSGIVVPCSNAAYVDTIDVLLKGAAEAGCKTAVLVTGGKTLKAAQIWYPDLPDVAFVRIGDFIREACESAKRLGFASVAVCCMPGKLAKYALAIEYTHAHQAEMSIPALLSLLVEDGMRREELAACENAGTVKECLERLPQETADAAVKILKQRAEYMIKKWTDGADVAVQVLSWENEKWQI